MSSYCLGNGCAIGAGAVFFVVGLPAPTEKKYIHDSSAQTTRPPTLSSKETICPPAEQQNNAAESCGMVKLQALSVIWHVRGRHVSLNPRPKKTSTPNPQNTNALASNTNIIILASMDALGNCCSQEICGHNLYNRFPTQAGLVTIGITWPQVLHISKV